MSAVPFSKRSDITDVAVAGDTAHVDFWYPRLDGRPKHLQIGLMDVRSTDGIRISYDFNRDGWVIEQSDPIWEDRGDHMAHVDRWREVYFAPSRALVSDEYENELK